MMRADMLVKLYDLPDQIEGLENYQSQGITFKRALPPDKHLVTAYIKDTFQSSWASECEAAFANKPVSCFIAVKDRQVIGFACYEATAKGFFGPMGVSDAFQGQGLGKALLLKSLLAMREEGYGYAIIGWVEDARPFYERTVQASVIPDSFPGVFSRLISQ